MLKYKNDQSQLLGYFSDDRKIRRIKRNSLNTSTYTDVLSFEMNFTIFHLNNNSHNVQIRKGVGNKHPKELGIWLA